MADPTSGGADLRGGGEDDVFPTRTIRTWIAERLDHGAEGRREVNAHIMELYREPLETYFGGTPFRSSFDAADVVHGFFADRLGRDGYLRDWNTSGLRLRRWLMNGLSFYVRELARRERRNRHRELPDAEVAESSSPALALDRAFAAQLVRVALQRAEDACRTAGLERHWQVFASHFVDEEPYGAIGERLGITPTRAAVMARAATRRFRSALADLLLRDGTPAERLDEEIRELLRSLDPD